MKLGKPVFFSFKNHTLEIGYQLPPPRENGNCVNKI